MKNCGCDTNFEELMKNAKKEMKLKEDANQKSSVELEQNSKGTDENSKKRNSCGCKLKFRCC